MAKQTVVLSSGVPFEREFPSGFGETPLRASSFRLPRGLEAGAVADATQEDMITLLSSELTRTRLTIEALPEDSPLLKGGFVSPDLGGFTSPGDGIFSPLDSVPLAFLQLSSWGKYVERDGIVSYVPTPVEFAKLLSGEGISPPPPPRDSKHWAKDYSIAIPAVRSVSIAEAEAFLGPRSVLLASKLASSEPKYEGEGKERRLVFGDPGLDSGQGPYQGTVRSILRDLSSYSVYDRYAVAATDAEGKVFLGSAAGGATRVLDLSVWKMVLPILTEAWEKRSALIKATNEYKWFSGHRTRDTFPIGCFKMGQEMTFGVAPTSVTEAHVTEDMTATISSLEKVAETIEMWTPERLTFFLRQLDLNLLTPLGLVGKSKDYPKGSYEVGVIRGCLNGADSGKCTAPEDFLASFPGKAKGFGEFLHTAFTFGADLICVDRAPGLQLPKSAFYDLPHRGKADHKAYSERSLSVERGVAIFSDVVSRPVEVTYPSFSTAVRRLSSQGFRWPTLRLPREGEDQKPLTWSSVAKTLATVPCQDTLLKAVREWVLTRSSEEVVSSEFEGELERFMGVMKEGYEAGMYSDISVYAVDNLVHNRAFATAKLSSVGAVLDKGQTDGLGVTEFLWGFKGGLPKDEEGNTLMSQELLAFAPFDPLSFDRSKDMAVLTQEEAETEVFGWYLRHPEAILPRKVSAEGEVLAARLVSTAESALKIIGQLPMPADFESILTQKPGPMVVKEREKFQPGRWTELLTKMRAEAEKARIGGLFEEGGAYMDALSFLREAPLSVPPNADGLSEYDRLFLARVAGATTAEDYIAALKEEGFVPQDYSFDRPEWKAAILEAIDVRARSQEKSRWSAPMALSLSILHPVSMELARSHPYLLHTAEFSSFHPTTLRGTSDALLQSVKEGRDPSRFSYSLARLKADLTKIKNDPEFVVAMVAKSEAVREDSVPYVNQLTQGPLYSGLVTEVVTAPSEGQMGEVTLSGVGGVYLSYLQDAFPSVSKNLGCVLKCVPESLPVGVANDTLKLDLSLVNGVLPSQVEMFKRNRLFSLRPMVEERTVVPVVAEISRAPEMAKGPMMTI